MSTVTVLATALSSTDTVVNNEGGALNNTNAAAQLAAAAAAITDFESPLNAAAAINAGFAATGTGIGVLAADISAGKGYGTLAADTLAILGDVSIIIGAAASTVPLPQAQAVAKLADLAGSAVTVAGVAINNDVNNTALDALITQDTKAIDNSITADISVAGSALSTAWSSVGTALSGIISEISTFMSDSGNSTAYTSDASSLASLLDAGQSPLASLFDATGITAEDTTETLNSDGSFTLSNSDGSSAASGTFNTDSSGNITGFTANTSDLNLTQSTIINGDGSLTIIKQAVNSSNVTQYTETDGFATNGSVSAAISGDDDTSYLYDSKINVSTGGDVYIDGTGDTITDSSGAGITFILGAGNNSSNTIKGSSPLFLRNDTVEFADPGVNGYTISVSGNVLTYGDPSTVTLSGAYGSMAHLEFADGSVINQLSNVQNWVHHIVNDANATQADTVVYGHSSGETLQSSTGGGDLIFGASGSNTLTDASTNTNSFYQTALYGGSGNDILTASSYAGDYLWGGAGNDTFNLSVAGSGYYPVDTMNGGAGNNTFNCGTGLYGATALAYVFENGSSQDTINDIKDYSIFKFGTGVTAGSLSLTYNSTNHNYVLAYGTNGATITLNMNTSSGALSNLHVIQLADGTQYTLNRTTLQFVSQTATITNGTTGNDTLNGSASIIGSVFNGGTGNDTFVPSGSDNLFIFNNGDGNDLIKNDNGDSYTGDRLEFGSGVTASSLSFSRTLANLILHYGTGTDTITFQGAWGPAGSRLPSTIWLADGTQLNTYDILNAQSIMPFDGTSGNDVLVADDAGNETLVGNGGYDTYYFGRGNGAVSIQNGVASTNVASGELDLASDVLASDVTFAQSGNDLTVSINGTSDEMTIKGWFSNSYSQLSSIVSGDGVRLLTQSSGNLVINNADGTSREVQITGLASGYSQIDNDYAGADATGLNTDIIYDFSAGGSQKQIYTDLPTGALYEYSNYTGADATGIINTIIDWTAGGSRDELQSGLATGYSQIDYDYAGADATGAVNDVIYNFTAGGSQEHYYSTLPTGASYEYTNYTGADADISGIINTIIDWSAGGSRDEFQSGLDPAYRQIDYDHAGADATGVTNDIIYDFTVGGSQEHISLLALLPTGVSLEVLNYSDWDAGGTLESTELYGSSSDDTITASGTGNETLIGSGGYDTYNFASGNGADSIQNGLSSNTGATGELDFASGISDQQIWFYQSGNDLKMDLLGTSDQMTIAGWFSDPNAQLQEIKAGGLEIDSQVASLVTAMATYSTNNSGFNPTIATTMPTDTALQSAIVSAWHS